MPAATHLPGQIVGLLNQEHVALRRTKLGSSYATDDGQHIPAHTLHLFECKCGWQGLGWYANEDRARAHFDRHLGPTDRTAL